MSLAYGLNILTLAVHPHPYFANLRRSQFAVSKSQRDQRSSGIDPSVDNWHSESIHLKESYLGISQLLRV